MKKFLHEYFTRPAPIAPLVTFRILFGGLMFFGAVRFMLNGWVEKLYGEPQFFFKYYGFEWVGVFSATGMYLVYGAIALGALMIMLGWRYRFGAALFFLSFTYAELTDLTNYLNHYYLVCLFGLMLIFLPAHRRFSLDCRRRPDLRATHVPAGAINVLILQLTIVYFFAGFAKLNPDWLFRAMPLAVWLPAKADTPIIGPLFQLPWAPYAFSWAGAFYDLTIAFFLMWRFTRPLAYIGVIVFHLMTDLLFNIGLFPYIMIFNTLIFFPAAFHERLLGWIGYRAEDAARLFYHFPRMGVRLLKPVLMTYFLIQLIFPLRYLFYSGNVLWNEEGYRFAWRVMLVEKIGQATFYVEDRATGRKTEVVNSEYLTPFQEKQMSIQPGFMLQYAHFLEEEFQREHGFQEPVITVDSYVALNGRPSQRYIDPEVDLTELQNGFRQKDWVLDFRGEPELRWSMTALIQD